MMRPSLAITRIPRASPTTMAENAKSAIPLTNSPAISFSFIPETTPERRAMAKKIAEISFMYQPWATKPQMIAPSPSTKITMTAFCLAVNSLSRRFSSAPNSLRFSISSWKAGDASGFFLTLRAYITTHATATAVSTTRAIVRNQSCGVALDAEDALGN